MSINKVDSIPADWRPFNYQDHNIINLGNNADYHSAFVKIARKMPSVVILHDPNLHELVLNVIKPQAYNSEDYLHVLETYGGSEARLMGQQFLDAKLSIDTLATAYPLWQWALGNPLGVIIHNPQVLDYFRPHLDCPILLTPLPYKSAAQLRVVRQRQPRAPHDAYRLIIFGFLNSPNRRLRNVLHALAEYPRRNRFYLDIVGDIKQADDYKKLVNQLGLNQMVNFHGFVREERLCKLLDEADLAINLRYPSRGESSGSQLRIWEHALPSVVSGDGWYSALPDSVVTTIAPDDETAGLHRLWDAFLANPLPYYDQGKQGRIRLEAEHTVEVFTKRLVPFLEETNRWRGRVCAADLCSGVGRYLSGFPEASQLLLKERCAREIHTLFGDV
ncbi:MAG: glycosyltransferase [Verrucomicrobiota bacterium]|nr:glycosyltransferase [Verrucomicrobiota bacterium]